jgi:serine phosphatase RsbU (regulator of sigma subunit)
MEPNPPDGGSGPHLAQRRINYQAVFRASVTPCAVITPEMVIKDCNDTFLALAARSREEVVGVELSSVFPPNAGNKPGADELANLRASLLEVLRSGKPDVMHVQGYPPFEKGTGSSHVRYFTLINIPIFDKGGAVAWILHRVEEVTEYVSTSTVQLPPEAETAAAALYARTRDLVRRNRELALQASHDRTVSRILQEAMLTELPEPQHLHLVARYVADTDTDRVGGDWYDAAVLPTGATMVAVGDVIGHDIGAAASMGQLRGLLRAFAWDRPEPPSAVLARVERGMSALNIETIATAILGHVEVPGADGARQLRWSNAGHPPPLLVSEEGTVEVLETRNDLPLGTGFGLPRGDHVHRLTPGSILILYTDGLVERRDRPPDEGIGQLADTLRRHHQLPLERLVDKVIREVAGDAPDDDVAVLAVSLDPHDQPRPGSQGFVDFPNYQ